MIFTNAAAKRFLFNTFWRQDVPFAKTYPASRCPRRQAVLFREN